MTVGSPWLEESGDQGLPEDVHPTGEAGPGQTGSAALWSRLDRGNGHTVRVSGEADQVLRVGCGDDGSPGQVPNGHDEGVDSQLGPDPGGPHQLASPDPDGSVHWPDLDTPAS